MSKRILTQEQIAELLRNPNVAKCSPKSIGYSHEFKISAIKQWDDGIPVKDIFKLAGINLDIIGRSAPKSCLKCWRRITKSKGADGLKDDGRGKFVGIGKGRPGTKNVSDAEKIRRLEATVAYLKAEKAFLMKLRSGKAE